MREVSSKEIEENLIDKDCIKIMAKAAMRYASVLSADEIDSCKKVAMWKALRGYDSSRAVKFHTYLYRGVMNECRSQIRFFYANKAKNELHENIRSNNNVSNYIEILEEVAATPGGDMLIHKYIDGFSTKEIAQMYSLHPETVLKRQRKAIKYIKSKLG